MFIFGSFRAKCIQFAWVVIFLLLIPLEDTYPGSTQAEYDHAWKLFEKGRLAESQQEAERGYIPGLQPRIGLEISTPGS